MIQFPTFNDSYNRLKTLVTQRIDLVTYPGSVVGDAIIGPLAYEDMKMQLLLDFVSKLQSLDQILLMLEDANYIAAIADVLGKTTDEISIFLSAEIDKIGNNYQLPRNQPLTATGTVQYGNSSPLTPTTTYTISAGSVIQSLSGVLYQVSSTVTVLGSAVQYDSDLGFYAVSVPVTSQSSGIIGNATAGTLNIMQTAITGFTLVTNKQAIVGGSDLEADADYVARIKDLFKGINLATKFGLKKLITDNFIVTDLYVVDSNDPLVVRNPSFGGTVDIYIQGESLLSNTYSFTYNGEAETLISSGFRPAEQITSIVTTTSTTWTFEKDLTSIYAGSVRALDKIAWSVTPTLGSTVTVTYEYDTNIVEIQAFLDNDEHKILNSDILVKQAIDVPIDITFSILTLPGYIKADVITTLNSTIEDMIGTLKLGEKLDQSDIVDLAYTVAGVDRVYIPFQVFNRTGLGVVENTITVANNEYVSLNALNIY